MRTCEGVDGPTEFAGVEPVDIEGVIFSIQQEDCILGRRTAMVEE